MTVNWNWSLPLVSVLRPFKMKQTSLVLWVRQNGVKLWFLVALWDSIWKVERRIFIFVFIIFANFRVENLLWMDGNNVNFKSITILSGLIYLCLRPQCVVVCTVRSAPYGQCLVATCHGKCFTARLMNPHLTCREGCSLSSPIPASFSFSTDSFVRKQSFIRNVDSGRDEFLASDTSPAQYYLSIRRPRISSPDLNTRVLVLDLNKWIRSGVTSNEASRRNEDWKIVRAVNWTQ